jgi:cytochrome c oxidase assembly factor CtaG
MAQHMILLVLAGPLLAAGAAGLPLTLAVPRPVRRGLSRWRAGRTGRWLRRPTVLALLAATAHATVLWGWHLPRPYLRALDGPLVHGAEHLSLAAAAWLLWSLVLGARRHRLSAPVAVLLLFATMMPASALAAALTFAPVPLYPDRALAPRGGDPLVDQQLAGLVMWIPMDVAVLAVGAVVFLGWLRQIERTTPSHRDLRPDDGFIAQAEG